MSGPALHGDLAQFFPAEVLQLLALAQAGGVLVLERGGERAEIFIERGRPVFARTDGPRVRLGELLLHHGALTHDQLEAALAGASGGRLGERLVARGVLRRAEVEQTLRETMRRVLYGLLLWRDGRFRFEPGELPADLDIRLEADLDRLILEGLRQADEARAPAAPA